MARDDFEEVTPIPRYRGRTVFRLTHLSLLGLAGAGVAGYYAWLYRGELQASAAELDAKRLAASTCASDLAQLTHRYDALNKKAAGTELEKQTAQTLATAVTADLSATREELESLRKQRGETEKRLAAFRELPGKFQKMIDSGTIEVEVRNGDKQTAM